MSRPTVINKNVIEKLEDAFLIGCTDTEACLIANIATSTLYKYQEENKEFSERKKLLKSNPVIEARRAVISSFHRRPDIAFKYLERRQKDEFSRNSTVLNVSLPQPIQSIVDRDKHKYID